MLKENKDNKITDDRLIVMSIAGLKKLKFCLQSKNKKNETLVSISGWKKSIKNVDYTLPFLVFYNIFNYFFLIIWLNESIINKFNYGFFIFKFAFDHLRLNIKKTGSETKIKKTNLMIKRQANKTDKYKALFIVFHYIFPNIFIH